MLSPSEVKIVLEAALLAAQEPLPISELRKMFDEEIGADRLCTRPPRLSSMTWACAHCRNCRLLKTSPKRLTSHRPRRSIRSPRPLRSPSPIRRPRPTSQRPRNPARSRPAARAEKLHKVLARSGLGSRRDMEAAIASGRLMVNGTRAALGQRVGSRDRVVLDGRPVSLRFEERAPRLLIYHKPAGEPVTTRDPSGRPTVVDHLPGMRGRPWIAIRRLDCNTCRLLPV